MSLAEPRYYGESVDDATGEPVEDEALWNRLTSRARVWADESGELAIGDGWSHRTPAPILDVKTPSEYSSPYE